MGSCDKKCTGCQWQDLKKRQFGSENLFFYHIFVNTLTARKWVSKGINFLEDQENNRKDKKYDNKPFSYGPCYPTDKSQYHENYRNYDEDYSQN